MFKVSKVTNVVASLFVVLMMMSWAVAEDWSQFRGPNGSGVSSSTGLPVEFGRGKNLLWQTALPAGHSSPVLTRDRIFVTAHTNEKENYKLLVMCLDRQTGKVLWQREVPRSRAGRLQNVNGPASPSPVTDGSNVYVFFPELGLLSFDGAGKDIWQLTIGPFNMF